MAEAPAEDMVSKEDVAGALADVLGVDAAEITALVSDEGSDEGAEEEADEGGEEEADDEGGEDLDLDLGEADEKEEVEEAYEADEKEDEEAVNEIRRIVRRELSSMIKEGKAKNIERRIRNARRHKSLAVAMGYKK